MMECGKKKKRGRRQLCTLCEQVGNVWREGTRAFIIASAAAQPVHATTLSPGRAEEEGKAFPHPH